LVVVIAGKWEEGLQQLLESDDKKSWALAIPAITTTTPVA
jgi:hypothetical protein